MGSEAMLAALAAVWVDRWCKYGGGLIVDRDCNNIQISMRMDWRRPKTGKEPWERRQSLWHDGWQVGRWRELQELCGEVPGLRGAIIDHVALHGGRTACGSYAIDAAV